MNKKIRFLSILILVMMAVSLLPQTVVFAAQKTFVRVEGIVGTIAYGEAEGTTVYEVLENLLKNKQINYTIEDGYYGPYLTEVDGLKSGKFGGYDGWMYFIQNGSSITSDRADVEAGDEVVFYYGDYEKTSIINNVIFSEEVPKANEEFELKLQYSYYDWSANNTVYKNLAGVKCIVDDKEYTTDEEGAIKLTLENGTHTYVFSGYNTNDVPSVVMTKGTFNIDSINKPVVLFNNNEYNKVQDNKEIQENVQKALSETTDYLVKNNKSPWGAFSLYKVGKAQNENLLENIKTDAEDIEYLKASELESSIIGIASLGYNPKNFMRKDFVKELFNKDIDSFLTNEIIFALITMDALNIKDEYKITRKDLANELLKRFDEGWNWTSGLNNKTDIDITSAAISALSPYYNGKDLDGIDKSDLVNKVDEAVEIIASKQTDNGDIASTYGTSSETDAFVILALTSIGIDPSGDKFTKENGSLTQAFLAYKGENGAFNHNESLVNNAYATENAMRALIALNNFNKEAYNYYSSDIDIDKLKVYGQEDKDEEKQDEEKEQNNNKNNNTEDKQSEDEISDETNTSDNNLIAIGGITVSVMLSLAYVIYYRRRENEA